MYYLKIEEMTRSIETKKFLYESSVFSQYSYLNHDEDTDVIDVETDVSSNMDIPVHDFKTYVSILCELRKDFDVHCAYSKSPISYTNYPTDNIDIVTDDKYYFAHWSSVYKNVLFSNQKQLNVFIYLSEFNRYANLLICTKGCY